MDFRPADATVPFRADVRAFLAAALTPEMLDRARVTGTYHDTGFARALGARGWIGAAWPERVGGSGLSADKFSVLWEELHYAAAPVDGIQLTEMVGHVLVHLGTPEQRAQFLPPILRGELVISLGYTEADAGSDLAAATTRAVKVEGGYVVNGAKLFTTMAHVADYVFLLVRTDPGAKKHRGLSMLLIPLAAEGIEIHAIATFGGERTNETVFRDVFVPEDQRVGDENGGWEIVAAALDVERSLIGSYVGQARRIYDALAKVALTNTHNDAVQDRLAELRATLEACRVMSDRIYCLTASGHAVTTEAAMAKLYVTDFCKRLARQAIDMVGPQALIGHSSGSLTEHDGLFEHAFRHSQILTIYGGSNEIQRNIIAQRALALPRE